MITSDVGERCRGDKAHSERARQVVVLATTLVAKVKSVLLLPLIGVTEQDHLTQERVHNHVLIVDLIAGEKVQKQTWSREREQRKWQSQNRIHGRKARTQMKVWWTLSDRKKNNEKRIKTKVICWVSSKFNRFINFTYIALFKNNELLRHFIFN